MTKRCSKCKEVKPLSDFNKQTASKDGHNNYCRACGKVHSSTHIKLPKIDVPDGSKHCKTCDTVQPVSEFVPQPAGKDGLYARCRSCCAERHKELASDDEWREKANANNRSYYQENKKAVSERTAAYQKANRQIYNKASRKWNLANPDKVLAKTSQRRARKMQAIPLWAVSEWDKFLVGEMYHLSRIRTKMLKTKFNVDHIIPLQSEFVCGLHCSSNLQVITFQENMVKGNRYWPDMWLDSDFPQTLQ